VSPRAALIVALARRFAAFAMSLAGATLLVQVLLWAAPGDAVDLVTGDPELRAGLIELWGLDRPLHEQWLRFVGHALQGDLGTSLTYRPGTEVSELVARAVWTSAPTVILALLLTVACGVGLAYASAGRWLLPRRLVQAVSVAPVFLLAAVSITSLNELTFALMGEGWIDKPDWFALPIGDNLLKSALAVTILAVGSSALSEVHASADEELRRIRASGFVDAARARGAALWPHVLWNLVPPMSTVIASRAAFFVGGLVVIEKVLQLNGAGAMLWQACRLRDYPLAMGLTVAAAAVVTGMRLLADVLRLGVDPRLRRRP
jgi:peptide/nickel transport system permease protein